MVLGAGKCWTTANEIIWDHAKLRHMRAGGHSACVGSVRNIVWGWISYSSLVDEREKLWNFSGVAQSDAAEGKSRR